MMALLGKRKREEDENTRGDKWRVMKKKTPDLLELSRA
jgi:hypothetical protein